MTEQKPLYNSAPLRNVAALVTQVERLQDRSPGLPGLGVFSGPSGFGKTSAAICAAKLYQAYSVQVKSVWRQKKLCEAILAEMGLRPGRTIADMVDQVAAQLALTDRPLLIDEADHLVNHGVIEIVRDIYEGCQTPVVLIGEELLPQKLMQWERVHGRVLTWEQAEPASLADVGHLAEIYAPGIELTDDFRKALLAGSFRSIRRICVNLARVEEFARVNALTRVGVEDWGDRGFFDGQAPSPRRWK